MDGKHEGFNDLLGSTVAVQVGCNDGAKGPFVEGRIEGQDFNEGEFDGVIVAVKDGRLDGENGALVGGTVGLIEGEIVGSIFGSKLGDAELEG